MKALVFTFAAMVAMSGYALADVGGQNRQKMAERLVEITEGQILCEEAGVQTVVIKDDDGEIVIACDKLAPGTSPAPGAN